MKKLFKLVLLTVLCFQSKAQTGMFADFFKVSQWGADTIPALVHLPTEYSSNPTKHYPLLVFLHGAGEGGVANGSQLSNIYNSSGAGGPAYFINQGTFPDSFAHPITGQYHKFIVVSPQNTGWSFGGGPLTWIINDVFRKYRIDTSRIYVTGLSAGGEGALQYASFPDYTTYSPAAIVPMSAAWGLQENYMHIAANDTVKAWGFGSLSDVHGVNQQTNIQYMNDAVPGSGVFTEYEGGHCCWNNFYNPTYRQTINGRSVNIYEWMLLNKRGASTPPKVPGVKRYPPVLIGLPLIQGQNFTCNPGDTLVITDSIQYPAGIIFRELHGALGDSIVIINKLSAGKTWTIFPSMFFHNCSYIKVTGTAPGSEFYGFKAFNVFSGFDVTGYSKHMLFEHISVDTAWYYCRIKQDGSCYDSLQYTSGNKFGGMTFKRGKGKHITADGMYIGNTAPVLGYDVYCENLGIMLPHPQKVPLRGFDIHIDGMVMEDLGRTAIQLSGIDSGLNIVENCEIINSGMELSQSQGSGIIIGGMTKNCIVRNNKTRKTFQYGLWSIGFGDSLHSNKFIGNDIDTTGAINFAKKYVRGDTTNFEVHCYFYYVDKNNNRFKLLTQNHSGVVNGRVWVEGIPFTGKAAIMWANDTLWGTPGSYFGAWQPVSDTFSLQEGLHNISFDSSFQFYRMRIVEDGEQNNSYNAYVENLWYPVDIAVNVLSSWPAGQRGTIQVLNNKLSDWTQVRGGENLISGNSYWVGTGYTESGWLPQCYIYGNTTQSGLPIEYTNDGYVPWRLSMPPDGSTPPPAPGIRIKLRGFKKITL